MIMSGTSTLSTGPQSGVGGTGLDGTGLGGTGLGGTGQARPSLPAWLAAVVTFALILVAFRDPLEDIVTAWFKSEEYNYGPIVPLLSAAMIWRDLRRSPRPIRGQWAGLLVLLFGLALGLLEALSQLHFPGQVGLFFALIGLFIALQGLPRARIGWAGLCFLFFAMPLALAIQVKLTAALQLASSKGAVALIQAYGLPVLREGNVIDLGLIKLQIAEACAGLRYLFPLATFGFLCGYLFVGRRISQVVIFLSSIPITIGMNIFRIAATAVLVDRWGIALAEGFFHSFEGWFVFCLCLLIMFAEMKVLCYLDRGGARYGNALGRSLIARLDLALPPRAAQGSAGKQRWLPVAFGAVLTVAALFGTEAIAARQHLAIPRLAFSGFPQAIGGWAGQDAPVDQDSIRALDATDFLSRNFTDSSPAQPVNVWIAYYEAQFSGNSAHSPEICIPGGGWEIKQRAKMEVPIDTGTSSTTLPVNRLVISQGGQSQLVYYWFVEGGRIENDEYQAKLSLILNSILRQRRDGALVRFITPIDKLDDGGAADARLRRFIGEFLGELPPYLPS
jgi:exosortase D (VPLPA-CTERM-specific)